MTKYPRLVMTVALRSRAALQAGNLALRHQLCVCRRSVKGAPVGFSEPKVAVGTMHRNKDD